MDVSNEKPEDVAPESPNRPDHGRLFVTGATGFVGHRLVQAFREMGETVRCMSRSVERLQQRFHTHLGPNASGQDASWMGNLEFVEGDVFERSSLEQALRGMDTTYYLIHSLTSDEDCWEKDRIAAQNFVRASEASGVRRIVYLGGLGRGPHLSQHLRSRQEVGEILASSSVECVELRAAVVIGAESLSFQLIEKLTRRLPIMLCPKWVETKTQPIAVADVIRYLCLAADLPAMPHRILEVGGADIVTYGDMIREYARLAHLRRTLVRVPVLTPFLSSLWLGLVTPASSAVGRHLIEGLRNPTIVEDDAAERLMHVGPMGITQAMQQAMGLERTE